ncbi:hypothetical protein [Petroclostridium sp. X23]|nr:hypothetical protein [Petroclostridium sp. X23]WHH58273.1 hypothetical protein QKW49_21115 [Petroclostridium sp. X23]
MNNKELLEQILEKVSAIDGITEKLDDIATNIKEIKDRLKER